MWQVFDYDNPPEGIFWVRCEVDEMNIDADLYGAAIMHPTGNKIAFVCFVEVYTDEHGLGIDDVGSGLFHETRYYNDDMNITHFHEVAIPDKEAV